MVFEFKPNSRIKASPQAAGELCETLSSTGGLTARRLLDASRAPTAPLHGEFEWDDSIAAENYRESQAAHIIRCLIVLPEQKESPAVRAFINIQAEAREYRPISAVLQSEALNSQMLNSARRDLEAFRQKYVVLSELAPVFNAINVVFQ